MGSGFPALRALLFHPELFQVQPVQNSRQSAVELLYCCMPGL
jgi:hypothetical protein